MLRLSVDQNVFQVVLFAFATRNRLVTRGEGFQRAYLRREPRLNSSLAENGDLPEVPLPRSLEALVGTTWLLATDNRLLPHVPLELTFRSDGRVEQILTAEECRSERDREDHMFRRYRSNGTCVLDAPYTSNFRRRDAFVSLGGNWLYLPAGTLGRERFAILDFNEALEGLLSYIPTAGVPREMRIKLVGAAPGSTVTVGEAGYEGTTPVMTRELASVTVAGPITRGQATQLHVTLQHPPTASSSDRVRLMFTYRAPAANEPLVAVHYLSVMPEQKER